MKRQAFTTTEAAYLTGVPVGSFARWARGRGISPVRRMRIGRSTVTLWARADLLAAGQLDVDAVAC